MSNISVGLADELRVGRGDPVYMAHAYLTKVPVTAIQPFIEAFTSPGDLVADPFAGSGMTGVAAASLGRRSRLFDISVLGRHIGENYLNIADPRLLREHAGKVMSRVEDRLGDVYSVLCQDCGMTAKLTKTIWTVVVACPACNARVAYYEALERADWHKPAMACPGCGEGIDSRLERVGEQAVVDVLDCECAPKQREQPAATPP